MYLLQVYQVFLKQNNERTKTIHGFQTYLCNYCSLLLFLCKYEVVCCQSKVDCLKCVSYSLSLSVIRSLFFTRLSTAGRISAVVYGPSEGQFYGTSMFAKQCIPRCQLIYLIESLYHVSMLRTSITILFFFPLFKHQGCVSAFNLRMKYDSMTGV